ncbi:hypothetical protein SIN8267_01918 [Sinobacterium norvegicum]|uniref:DUF3187 family protein n=1 Tax=Sinobacterium norvegicum TaxID=1641715 RepID=A0ABN8EH91_9GAMM|nr:DUF3187 family protein [Sinobacterium norvegicum]CAH0991803.1 hypothetical protein SIN8267_01918 [Sinobacterium norvegicum]
MIKKNVYRLASSLVMLTAAGFVTSASASEILNQPMLQADLSPFAAITGLPAMESAKLLANGQSQWSINAELANNFAYESSDSEAVWLDGESYRTTLRWRRGSQAFGQRWQLGVDLPYLSHDGGSLDGFIEDWHDTFNLPNSNRELFPQDQLAYRYSRVGGETVEMLESGGGIGDVSMTLAWQLVSDDVDATAVSASLKLPTGDDDQLLGSGGTELALGMSHSSRRWFESYRLTYHLAGGVLVADQGTVLAEEREAFSLYGGAGLSWQCLSALALKVQLDGHSALYDSDLAPMKESLQFTVGGSIGLTPNWVIDVAVVEDILVDSTSDVVFQLGLKYRGGE